MLASTPWIPSLILQVLYLRSGYSLMEAGSQVNMPTATGSKRRNSAAGMQGISRWSLLACLAVLCGTPSQVALRRFYEVCCRDLVASSQPVLAVGGQLRPGLPGHRRRFCVWRAVPGRLGLAWSRLMTTPRRHPSLSRAARPALHRHGLPDRPHGVAGMRR